MPRAADQAPGYYRHRVGEIEVTALLGGNLVFPGAALPNLSTNHDPAVADRLRAESFAPAAAGGEVPLR